MSELPYAVVGDQNDRTAFFAQEAHAEMAKKAQAIIAVDGAPNYNEAIDLLSGLLKLYPNHEFVWNYLAAAFYKNRDFQSALNCYKRVNEIAPNREFYIYNIHRALMALDRPGDAIAFIDQQLEKFPGHFELMCRRADSLRENGQFEEAILQIEEARKIQPDHPGLNWAKGQNLLLLGRYIEGFQHYESRYALNTDKLPRRDFACPRWVGVMTDTPADIQGKVFLVHCEQGFGDTIMAGRYLQMLKEKVGTKGTLILQTKEPMHRLFRESGADMIINITQNPGRGNIPKPDYHSLLMTLPGALGTTVNTIPPPMKVHIPDACRRKFDFLGDRSDGAVRIGIVWSGSNNWDDNHKRGLSIQPFLRLAENPQHRVYSFQKDVHAGELYTSRAHTYIEDIGKYCDDFADTAAALEYMDLIIMTDTSVAHLAGSMGKRVINLIQRLPYWIYWFNNKKSTPWYPSMELIDRNNYGDVFERDYYKEMKNDSN